ncbi:ADP-ribosylation factor-binding protein GGA3-like isoform X2 [Synchiropus splendidus]|uniref:ADP-ribosylation factor-binding protein GGA3-like isoform X2 n=1 Tax=Synchiropus splendidus TaxID=270530 RepID=UPI00237D6F47|nr:ADP-ribosylation factor-binding protein GGA3-like isoform X2 [Synchiropus splendidus]
MARTDDHKHLDSWLSLATDPNNPADRWGCVQGFYQAVNWMTDGPQVALRLLAEKIKSANQREALQALNVLQACMDNCGTRFQSEATSFPFFNQLVKIIETQDVPAVPQKVKDKVIELLYRWRLSLKEDLGVELTYIRLKAQGIIEKDPVLPDAAPTTPSARSCIFDREGKTQLLDRLIKSGRPEDWEAANKLIRSTVQEDREKKEMRRLTLMQVKSSTGRLREKCAENPEPSADMKDLYEACKRLLPDLRSLAGEAAGDEEGLAEIQAASEELTLVLCCCEERMARRGETRREGVTEKGPTSSREIKTYRLIDLSALEVDAESPLSPDGGALLSGTNQGDSGEDSSQTLTPEKPRSYSDDLIQLNDAVELWSIRECEERGPLLRSRGCGGLATSPKFPNPSWSEPTTASPDHTRVPRPPAASLADVFVTIGTIRSSQLEPIRLFDQDGVHTSLHFARSTDHPNVAVAVICTVNSSALHVEDFSFMAAVPKKMAVKLQPASATNLPAYNPLLPPAAVSQILLLENPHGCKVRLRYKVLMTHGRRKLNRTGDVHNFPDWSIWIGL